MTTVFVPRERRPGETRVAATPETVKRLIKEGFAVQVEPSAGETAQYLDADYQAAGATLTGDGWGADIVVKVAPTAEGEVERLKPGALLVGMLNPYAFLGEVQKLRDRGVSSIAMELVPRITKAQVMDALSSQANIAGYKAVLIAAAELPRHFPLLMTAAGTIHPAKVVILGAGVAGLQAIATAKRLGAVVEVSDVRAAVKEQVESLGGKFIDLGVKAEGEGGYAKELTPEQLAQQQQILADKIAAADVVITTAQVPGRPAPRLVSKATVERMRPGSVIVDLAVETGGNVEGSVAGEDVVVKGVKILGRKNLPGTLPHDASAVYARNVLALLQHVAPKGQLALKPDDEIVKGCLLTHDKQVTAGGVAERLNKS